jgi:predicted transcriptional regulator of viral defense system
MHAAATHTERVLQLVRKNGWLRAGDLADARIPRVVLTRMTASGQLERAARGLYRLPGTSSSEHEGLVTVARKVPQAVICLLSALQFHGLTTQLPWQVWIAMPRGSHVPRLDHPPIKMVQFTGEAYTHGIEIHERDGVTLQVYGVAKTSSTATRSAWTWRWKRSRTPDPQIERTAEPASTTCGAAPRSAASPT